jgi:hypothetical protein
MKTTFEKIKFLRENGIEPTPQSMKQLEEDRVTAQLLTIGGCLLACILAGSGDGGAMKNKNN